MRDEEGAGIGVALLGGLVEGAVGVGGNGVDFAAGLYREGCEGEVRGGRGEGDVEEGLASERSESLRGGVYGG